MKTITVVGASLAGLTAARQLRAQGFDGRLVIVGEEPHQPYDRPPLSKDFLLGRAEEADLALTDATERASLEAEWMLGVHAIGLDHSAGEVMLDNGAVRTDGVVIATGARPRTLAGQGDLSGVHTLRTIEDALALRADLDRAERVVVVGAGFVGAEVASTCAARGLDVTVLEAAPKPLAGLGEEMASACAALHGDHGVRLLCGTGVVGLSGDHRVREVLLTDGSSITADVVVVGVGVVPTTTWLEGSGISLANGVACDSGCRTSLSGVVAVGDVAHVGGHRVEHWTNATQQPRVAVRNLLAGALVESCADVPYFWSDQYGVRIQFAGRVLPSDKVEVVDGSVEERAFVAVWRRETVDVGVLAFNTPKLFNRLRRGLRTE
ncbi:NAD(P)/FAD-dependent oxidoreductase [Allokutzneria albata]|uniref:NADPH-dependent 2,4-dienoyl-CoA reductase, sulfur reductase n=1 Tax=Allokutzneria albata TaxID=211114 RepID=A0A1H0D7K5_ALLAB|nr:FAD/NAD(P)-binding oxidoreductase [Allokutzneria albata]SDN66172.1 NADPH-dependent 2,4-dienoyl-CoA reductase, sulfur reductase [Allokutzneria albata]